MFAFQCADAEGDPVEARIVTPPQRGTATVRFKASYMGLVRGFDVDWVPDGVFEGKDGMTVAIDAPGSETVLQEVYLVFRSPPDNQLPQCWDNVSHILASDPYEIAIRCRDGDGDPISGVLNGQPARGTALEPVMYRYGFGQWLRPVGNYADQDHLPVAAALRGAWLGRLHLHRRGRRAGRGRHGVQRLPQLRGYDWGCDRGPPPPRARRPRPRRRAPPRRRARGARRPQGAAAQAPRRGAGVRLALAAAHALLAGAARGHVPGHVQHQGPPAGAGRPAACRARGRRPCAGRRSRGCAAVAPARGPPAACTAAGRRRRWRRG